MAKLLSLLLCGAAALSFGAAASNHEDGFVWLDANTKIKLTPIGKSASTGSTAPEQPKKDKAKKKAEK